jgi:hypothetical protein
MAARGMLGALGMARSGVTPLAVGVLLGLIEIAHGIPPRVHDRQPT